MTNLKQNAVVLLANAIKGQHAEHHASVIVGGIWIHHRGDEAAAYAEVIAKAEKFAA